MRRILAAAGALTLTVVALTACSTPASETASCSRDQPDSSALDLVTVGDTPLGTRPDVTLSAPLHVDGYAARDVVTGTGPAVTTDAQAVLVDLTLIDGSSRTPVASSSYTGDPSLAAPLANWSTSIPGLVDALSCATEGSRIVMALGPDDVAPETLAGLRMKPDATAVVVLDLRRVYLAAADGAPQFNDRTGMPSVVLAPDGQPGVIVPDSDAPAEAAVEVLKRGDGPEITGDQPVRLHYTAVDWNTRRVVETTWGEGPRSVGVDTLGTDVATALRGQTVGSQILAVVPPGSSPSAPAGDSVVYVIDILGLDAAG